MTELKPCPFCGSAEVEARTKIDMEGFWCVECCNCYSTSGWWEDKQTAIKRWNRRSYES